MSSIVLNGDTSGSVTLSPPAVAGTQTVTLPVASGVLQVSGNQPAFSVYKSSTQALTSGVYTKVTWSTAVFDTNSNFSIANSRFTPTVAGYYQINYTVNLNGNVPPTSAFTGLYKNGSQFYNFPQVVATTVYAVAGSALIYLNGSTDYVEVYVQTSSATCSIYGDATNTWFNGSLVRSA